MVYYNRLSTTVIALHPDGPDEEVHLFCFSLLQTSHQPITCGPLLGVRSGRPAGAQAQGEFTSNWVLECDRQTSRCGMDKPPFMNSDELWAVFTQHLIEFMVCRTAAALFLFLVFVFGYSTLPNTIQTIKMHHPKSIYRVVSFLVEAGRA